MSTFEIGDRVKHKVFGEGDVQEINSFGESTKLTIQFDDIKDRKVIMATYIKIVKQK